jgi:NhaP-type Na+/H+ or K+/H+ antiporter
MEHSSFNYDLLLLVIGLTFLGTSFLTRLLSKTPVSIAMVFIILGLLVSWVFPGIYDIDPVENSVFIERITEMAVIISLMGVGLKIDRPIGWRSWQSTWRLLAITMPLCIAALTLGGVWLAGLPLAAAVLLGAVIAPTDPVLAAEVQVGAPNTGDEKEENFALTSEAGLNDGLAFPFVNLAVVLATVGLTTNGLTEWFKIDVVWKIFAGLAVGALLGHFIAVLVNRLSKNNPLSDGFVAIALTLFTYGATELVNGYGFIGVFVAAIMFRRYEREHEHHHALHSFSEQIEQLLMSLMLILLGITIGQGLFNVLTWQAMLLGLIFLFLIRPAAGMLGLTGTKASISAKMKISWFGIRGIGTFYYLAYGLNHADFEETQARIIWAVAGFIVLVSVFMHGITAYYLMNQNNPKDQ